jgi:hypothetical protein
MTFVVTSISQLSAFCIVNRQFQRRDMFQAVAVTENGLDWPRNG